MGPDRKSRQLVGIIVAYVKVLPVAAKEIIVGILAVTIGEIVKFAQPPRRIQAEYLNLLEVGGGVSEVNSRTVTADLGSLAAAGCRAGAYRLAPEPRMRINRCRPC